MAMLSAGRGVSTSESCDFWRFLKYSNLANSGARTGSGNEHVTENSKLTFQPNRWLLWSFRGSRRFYKCLRSILRRFGRTWLGGRVSYIRGLFLVGTFLFLHPTMRGGTWIDDGEECWVRLGVRNDPGLELPIKLIKRITTTTTERLGRGMQKILHSIIAWLHQPLKKSMKQHMIVSSQHRKPKSDHPNENGQLHCNIITARPGGEVRKYMKRCDFSKTTAKKKTRPGRNMGCGAERRLRWRWRWRWVSQTLFLDQIVRQAWTAIRVAMHEKLERCMNKKGGTNKTSYLNGGKINLN